MAEDDLRTEYHLTPTGWAKGTEWFFRRVTQNGVIKRPQDAWETWERRIYQRSGWSPESYGVNMVWHDETVSEPDRKELRSRFGMPEGEYNENIWVAAFRDA